MIVKPKITSDITKGKARDCFFKLHDDMAYDISGYEVWFRYVKYKNTIKRLKKIKEDYPVLYKHLKKIALRIKKLQLKYRKIILPLNIEICRKCSCCCCAKPLSYLEQSDYIYYNIMGERLPKTEITHKANKCMFLNKMGCTLKDYLRPKVCITAYSNCHNFLGSKLFKSLSIKLKNLTDELYILYQILFIKTFYGEDRIITTDGEVIYSGVPEKWDNNEHKKNWYIVNVDYIGGFSDGLGYYDIDIVVETNSNNPSYIKRLARAKGRDYGLNVGVNRNKFKRKKNPIKINKEVWRRMIAYNRESRKHGNFIHSIT